MNDEQLPTDAHPGIDPTNASLAAQNRKILQGLARLEKMIEDPSPTPIEIANNIDDALRADAELETPKFSDFGRFYLSQLVLEIRCPIKYAPPEAELEAEEQAGPVIDYIPVSWEEYGKRINAALAKSAKNEREMTALLDGVLTAGLLATSVKGSYVLALAELFETMIPDEEPMTEIPDDWAPVLLAINPMTGEFVTIAGPRSEPDGRVEPLETMLSRWVQGTVGNALLAVREAGRPQPKPVDTDGERDCAKCHVEDSEFCDEVNAALVALEGSCPICRRGEVGKLGNDFECAKCGRLFCGKCGGVRGPAHENVNACSCEERPADGMGD